MFVGVDGALGGLFGSNGPGRPLNESNKVQNILSPGGPSMGGTGMFGVQGQARDILGRLGDIWLMRQRLQPEYRNRQVGQIMSGAANGNSAEAIQQLYQMGALEEAQMMQNQNLEQKNNLAEQQIDQQTLDNRAQQDALDLEDDMLERAANFYASVTDETSFQRVQPLVQRYFETRGVPTTRLPTSLQEAQDFTSFNYTPTQQYDDARADENTDSLIAQRQASSSQGAARVAQGERRTQAYESRVANQSGRPNSGGSRSRGSAVDRPPPGNPADYRGRSFRNSNGTTYRSNGTRWVEQ